MDTWRSITRLTLCMCGLSALVVKSSMRGKILFQTYSERTLLALSQLARPWQLNILLFLTIEAQFGLSTIFFKIALEALTLALPHVCRPQFSVSKGMHPVRHLAVKSITTVNYCGRQLARMMGGLMGVLGCRLGRGVYVV